MPIKLNTASGGGVILTGANTASDKTITVPAVDATMLTDSSGVLNIGSGQVYKDASGNVGVGTTSPNYKLNVGSTSSVTSLSGTGLTLFTTGSLTSNIGGVLNFRPGLGTTASDIFNLSICAYDHSGDGNADGLSINGSDGISFCTGSNSRQERARIDSSGNLLVGTTSSGPDDANVAGIANLATGVGVFSVSGGAGIRVNRKTNDGDLVEFKQDGTKEGSISVSGTTVSYNGGHLARWAQMLTKPDLLKGTVMSNLDEMNEYFDADGNPVPNEQLNKVKVSDVEGDANVAGVFVNWTHDEAHDVDEINMAMTGDMIIRIAQGVTVQKGDLLMSAGDGTAKPQGDDIVRSKTVAKVTSSHVTCTYDDGSYCVPCVLMAC